MKKYVSILICLIAPFTLAHAQSSPFGVPLARIESPSAFAQCYLVLLQANENQIGVPKSGQFEYEMTAAQGAPQSTFSAYKEFEVSWSKDKTRKLKFKTFLTLTKDASLWPVDGNKADRLQLHMTVFDETDRIIAVHRDHSDRVLRVYQIEEILKNQLFLRLALPIAVDQEVLYTHQETREILQSQGTFAAVQKALSRGLISGHEPVEMSFQCQTL